MKLKVVNEIKVVGFYHGMVVYGCINSLYQDIIGKQAYIEKVQNNWIDGVVTIPIAIGILVLVVIDLVNKARTKAKEDAQQMD